MRKAESVRLKFDLDKLNDPEVIESFQAKIGGKFAPLLFEDKDIHSLTEEFSTAVVETAKEVLGKPRRIKKPLVTENILKKCDKRRELKKTKNDSKEKKDPRKTIGKQTKSLEMN